MTSFITLLRGAGHMANIIKKRDQKYSNLIHKMHSDYLVLISITMLGNIVKEQIRSLRI